MLNWRNFKKLLWVGSLLVIWPDPLHSQATGPLAGSTATELIHVLGSSRPAYEKAMACRQLAMVGDRSAVPALAGLLADKELATYARTALEMMPDAAADEALLKAVDDLEGDLLVGVLRSIGKRRHRKAIAKLHELLSSDDEQVVVAAARAIGDIGNVQAAKMLTKQLSHVGTDQQRDAAIAAASLQCAQRLEQQGHRALALALYDAVSQADVPQHVALAATRGAIAAGGPEGFRRLSQQLQSDNEAGFRVALQVARQLGAEAEALLIRHFHDQPAARQHLLIYALDDIGGEKTLPLLLEAAGRAAKEVRIAAIDALSRAGDSSALDPLRRALLDSDVDIATASVEAIAALDADGVNASVTEMLESSNPQEVLVAARLAGRRSITSVSGTLLSLATHDEKPLRLAAIHSLGATISLAELPKLLALAADSEQADRQTAARQALQNACARLPHRACADLLAAAMDDAPLENQVLLLEQLAAVGGPKALETVAAAARSDEDVMQDTATRLLGQWATADVAPELLQLAKTLTSEKYRIRALRGYVRVARQLNMASEQRVEVCRNVLRMGRKEEKSLALKTLARVETTAALALCVSHLEDAALKEDACGAIVTIADRLVETAPSDVRRALRRVVTVTDNAQVAERAKSVLARAK